MGVIIINRQEKKSSYQKKLSHLKTKGLDAYKYCGKISIRGNAVEIQKNLRNEWK